MENEYLKKLSPLVSAIEQKEKKYEKDYSFDMENIKKVFAFNKWRYGYRRITIALNKMPEYKNNPINHKKVLKLMRLLGLKCKSSNVSRYNSYKGNVGETVNNLLLNKVVDEENNKTYYERNFNVTKPNQVWCTDIIEFKVGYDKIYLSPIIDLYNEEIISYDLSEHLNMLQITNMMKQAYDRLNKDDKLIFHSDQGWQYQQNSFQKSLEEHNITKVCLEKEIVWITL